MMVHKESFCEMFSDVENFQLELSDDAESPTFSCDLLLGYHLADSGYCILDGLHLQVASIGKGDAHDCAILIEKASMVFSMSDFPGGVTTTNPYSVDKKGECVFSQKHISCMDNSKACPSDTFIACQTQLQYYSFYSANDLQSSLPTMLNAVAIVVYILGMMAAISRPSERCVTGLPLATPYASVNDLIRIAAFGVLLILSLAIVELSTPEGVLLISTPFNSATPMGYFSSCLSLPGRSYGRLC